MGPNYFAPKDWQCSNRCAHVGQYTSSAKVNNFAGNFRLVDYGFYGNVALDWSDNPRVWEGISDSYSRRQNRVYTK